MSSHSSSSEQNLLNNYNLSTQMDVDLPIPNHDASMADNLSITSTVEYTWDEHESFSTYQHKLLQIVSKDSNCNTNDIRIEHIKGGSNNRVAAISVVRKEQPEFTLRWLKFQLSSCMRRPQIMSNSYDDYVIRVPRDKQAVDIRGGLALLKDIANHVNLPVPRVVAYDISQDNVLKQSYMVQPRLKGENLVRFCPKLTKDQKCDFAKQMAQLAPTIASSLHCAPGTISPDDVIEPHDGSVLVNKFITKDLEPVISDPSQKPLDHLLELLEYWSAFFDLYPEYWANFTKLAKALEARGFLSGPNVLIHGDLEAYNLLVTPTSDKAVSITGVLDWDFAYIAPEVFAYRIPSWLWAEESVDADGVRCEWIPPNDNDEDQLIYDTFVDSISPEQDNLYFAPEALIARRAWLIFREGLPSDYHVNEAQKVLWAWNTLHPEDGVEAVGYDDDSDDESNDGSMVGSDDGDRDLRPNNVNPLKDDHDMVSNPHAC